MVVDVTLVGSVRNSIRINLIKGEGVYPNGFMRLIFLMNPKEYPLE